MLAFSPSFHPLIFSSSFFLALGPRCVTRRSSACSLPRTPGTLSSRPRDRRQCFTASGHAFPPFSASPSLSCSLLIQRRRRHTSVRLSACVCCRSAGLPSRRRIAIASETAEAALPLSQHSLLQPLFLPLSLSLSLSGPCSAARPPCPSCRRRRSGRRAARQCRPCAAAEGRFTWRQCLSWPPRWPRPRPRSASATRWSASCPRCPLQVRENEGQATERQGQRGERERERPATAHAITLCLPSSPHRLRGRRRPVADSPATAGGHRCCLQAPPCQAAGEQ